MPSHGTHMPSLYATTDRSPWRAEAPPVADSLAAVGIAGTTSVAAPLSRFLKT